MRCTRVKQHNNRGIEDFAYTCQVSTLVIPLLNSWLLPTHGVRSSLGGKSRAERLLLPLRLIPVHSRSCWWRPRLLTETLIVLPRPDSHVSTRTLPREVTVSSAVETPNRVRHSTLPKMVLGANSALGWSGPGVTPLVGRSLPSSVRRSVLGGIACCRSGSYSRPTSAYPGNGVAGVVLV